MLLCMSAMSILAALGSTGAIGPLRCGASLNEIAAVLGPPWDIGRVSKRRRWPHLFSYGDVELCVCRCRRVTSMCVQTWRDVVELPVEGSKTLAVHPGDLTLAQVTIGLDAIGCHTRPVPRGGPPGQLALHTERSGVTFTFRTNGSEPLLESAGTWIGTHECDPPAEDLPDDGFGIACTTT